MHLRSMQALCIECYANTGSDFSPASIGVAFVEGEVSATFRINITDDAVAEPGMEVFVALVDRNTSHCALLIFISDDDGKVACHFESNFKTSF